LKNIEYGLGFRRPPDVAGLSGEDAAWLWRAWERNREARSRNRLLRYCAADVIATAFVAAEILGKLGATVAADLPVWEGQLPGLDAERQAPDPEPPGSAREPSASPVGTGEAAMIDRMARWRKAMRARQQPRTGDGI
jgi:hypothetical protein